MERSKTELPGGGRVLAQKRRTSSELFWTQRFDWWIWGPALVPD